MKSDEEVPGSGNSHSIESRNVQLLSAMVQVDGAQIIVAEAGSYCSTDRRRQVEDPKATTEC